MNRMANDPDELVARVLVGEVRAIARMMSLAEAAGTPGHDAARAAIAAIHAHTGKAHVVGLTGVPGSGKSTLVHALAQSYRKQGLRVGIVAVDPTSPYSGGAILGDRIRMAELAGDDGVFIRSLATRGALGGLAPAALDTVDVLDAAGFDIVMVETVGVGQDEVDIARAAHTVVVVSAPGLGDGIQAIKAGVLEIADIHVVSKCDRDDSSRAYADLKGMLQLGGPTRERFGWEVPVARTSAETGDGIDELAEIIVTHRRHLETSGEIDQRRRQITETRIVKTAEELLRRRLLAGETLKAAVDAVINGETDPRQAARGLLKQTD